MNPKLILSTCNVEPETWIWSEKVSSEFWQPTCKASSWTWLWSPSQRGFLNLCIIVIIVIKCTSNNLYIKDINFVACIIHTILLKSWTSLHQTKKHTAIINWKQQWNVKQRKLLSWFWLEVFGMIWVSFDLCQWTFLHNNVKQRIFVLQLLMPTSNKHAMQCLDFMSAKMLIILQVHTPTCWGSETLFRFVMLHS